MADVKSEQPRIKEMKTKAEILQYLKDTNKFNILNIYTLNFDSYSKNSLGEFEKIKKVFGKVDVIVRSSSRNEDQNDYSNAGGFDSVLNVPMKYECLDEAIRKVYNSYHTLEDEQILIQPMLDNIVKSGVVFTADIDTYADYYIVNYSESNNSEIVTAGKSNKTRTFIYYKYSEIDILDSDMKKLVAECRNIEEYLETSAVDIEFAINDLGEVFIFQARPIARGNKIITEKTDLSAILRRIHKKAEKLSKPHPFLLGDTTIFGVMPDWNPAEILGIRPRKLAISLYKELITDNIWAHQRKNYGYRDLTQHPLMISFCGIPYIDTRITFNSFIPANLDEDIAEKLVNYYLGRLSVNPIYHDKIEFEIVYSCFYFGLPKQLEKLLAYGFNEKELKRIELSLLELTNNIINPSSGLYKKEMEKVKLLDYNYELILNSNISLVDKIYWLIEECKSYGTLPFAGVARAAFIAVQILSSFVSSGIIDKNEYDRYMNSLDTVNKKMNRELQNVYKGILSKEVFLDKYGHIRPGTYDILSKRYDEAYDEYFDKHSELTYDEFEVEEVGLTKEQMQKVDSELKRSGLNVSAGELMTFIKEAIEGREYIKFRFTRVVSKILQLVEELGMKNNLTKEDMSFVDISIIKQLYVDLYTGDIKTMFLQNINDNKKQYEAALKIKLPSLIVEPEDIYSFWLLDEEPNYITQKVYTGRIVNIDDLGNEDLEGAIVFIKSADPGYDYLFSKNIGGLVTQFGGANSHMAIRCAELGVPAIIGAGEQNYTTWNKFEKITIDCVKKQVRKI